MKTKLIYKELAPNKFQFTHWSKIAKTYNEAVEMVLSEIEKSRPFLNYRKGELGVDRLKETDRKREFIDKVTNNSLVEIEVQMGEKYKGVSVQEARKRFVNNEFGLGAYEVGCILLAKPSILQKYEDLWIDCAGDEYDDPDSDVRFALAPVFFFYDSGVEFGADRVDHAHGFYGSSSGFVPQSLESGKLESFESLPATGTMEIEELETVVTKLSYKGRIYKLEE